MLKIGSARTGQELFTVRSFGGGQLNLPPEKARAFLEFLRDLGDASIFIQVAGCDPAPVECMLGGAVTIELEYQQHMNRFSDRATNGHVAAQTTREA